MKKSEVKAMAECIVSKIRVLNQAIIYRDEEAIRNGSHQLSGMLKMLKTLNIDTEIIFDYSGKYYTGFKIPEYDIDIII